jgi:photosystem II stability/assembly factor-like uncharacterized protein
LVSDDKNIPVAVDAADEPMLSRRQFVVRAGLTGAAMTAAAPRLGRGLLALPEKMETRWTAAPSITHLYSGLRWRMLGPFRGGRVAAATGVPGRRNEFYFGAVNGGVWKSIDAGRVWTPVFDSQNTASIGAIAVAPSSPDTVYVGSGESTLRDSVGFGNGMYKSADAGKTWTHIGLEDTQHIGKVAVDPRNPDIVFVAAIGHLYAANDQRGLFRSLNGGKSWKKLLGDENVGAVEVVIDPRNSKIVYAGLWNTRRPPWFTYAPTNGPGGGIWKSTDGGNTWKQLTVGLPNAGIGRTGIAIARTNPKRVYAVVDCLVPEVKPATEPPQGTGPQPGPLRPGAQTQVPQQGGFFRSDDAGATWTRMSGDQALWGRGWYFEKLTVDPTNADIVYVPNVAVNRTMDGGKTWEVIRGSPGGDDYHQPWVSPDDPNTMIVASDQGAVITHNAKDEARRITWSSWLNQPTAQLYHVSVDYRFPYWVTAAQQDSGAVAVCSRGKFAEITMRDWEPIAPGGESGYTAGDPLNPGIVYGGTGTRYNLATNTPLKGVSNPQPPAGEKLRADWTQPLVFSKKDPKDLYFANQYVFQSKDGANTWTMISPDLTRATTSVPPNLDATAAAARDRNDNRGVVYTIAPSPLRGPVVWVGTDDGYIQLTTTEGRAWTNVTPPAITEWSRVTMIDASHFDVDAAYASVDRHQLQDFDPYIYRTRDQGKSWQLITNGLPKGVYVHVVKEDPIRRGLLFAGTERGVYFSIDDGDNWLPLQLNLPVTSMRDFEIYQNDLILATHGRGFWVIDDISSLRQITPALLNGGAYLFEPGDSINYIGGGGNGTPLQKDEPHADNAPNGAVIDYYLASAANAPVTIDILDSTGKVLRTFSSAGLTAADSASRRGRGPGGRPGLPSVSPLWQTSPEPISSAAGMHRVVWNPVVVPDRGNLSGGAAVFPRGDITQLAGTFTARLTVGTYVQSQTFVVKADPRTRD